MNAGLRRARVRSLLWTAAILAPSAVACWAQPSDSRAPVPDDAALAKARELIREVFEREHNAAKTATARAALARKMFDQASKTRDDPAAHYALLRIAADVAAEAGDARLAVEAVDRIIRAYEVEGLRMKADCLGSVARTAMGSSQRQFLAKEALALIDAAVEADDYATARRLAGIAVEAARKGRDYPLVRQIVDRKQELQSLEKAYEGYRRALATLEDKPTDAEANLAAGRYLCVAKGDWDRGIPMLALGSDPELKARAVKELEAGTSAEERVAVGDAWWDMAEKHQGWQKESFSLRAGSWYQSAQPRVTSGLVKLKLKNRLESIVKIGRPIPKLTERKRPKPAGTGPVEGVLHAVLKGHQGQVWSVAFTPDGGQLASTGYDATIRFWDTKTGRLARSLKTPDARPYGKWPLALSPDGTMIAFSNGEATVRLWDVASGREKAVLKRHTVPVYAVAFSPDGKVLASSGQKETTYLWDTSSGRVVGTLQGRCPWNWTVVFSPDGKRLASIGCDGQVKIWDLAHPEQPQVLGSHEAKGRCIAFSPDGRHVASAGGDAKVMIWSPTTGERTAMLTGHTKGIWAMAYSPDGSLVASGSHDGTIRLWSPESGTQRAKLDSQNDPKVPPVLGLAFSPDGTQLASANKDGTVKLWNIVTKPGRAGFPDRGAGE